MDEALLQPISGHAIRVLFLQLAGLLALARLLAEGMRRLGQPAVLGELLAGLLLGPTVLGHFAPEIFLQVFPQEVAQFHLLEVISWLGLVLLLLLTGLETDIRVMMSLGRAALFASACGMGLTFSTAFVVGWFLPDRFLVDPTDRILFSALLATGMAITALPVIAKILIDLNLIKRNLGVVTLSAGVLDDTVGWMILSIIAGAATGGGFSGGRLALTILGLGLFLVVMRWLAYPVLARLVRYVNERVELAGADLTLIMGVTFFSAAAAEFVGVHAVFGAFVAGLMLRQIPRVKQSSLHTLEQFVLSVLSPIFFAYVGLTADLWALTGWVVPAVVLSVAVAAKLAGCYAGARLGNMSHWEALALGFAMNARGAMGLIVALIGSSLGLLTAEMYSTIVLIAVITSFLAPSMLRVVAPKLPLTDEERRRLEADTRQLMLPAGPLRILVPTAGGSNALAAFALAAPLIRSRKGTLTALYVKLRLRRRQLLWKRLLPRRKSLAGRGLERHLEAAAARLGDDSKLFSTRRVRAVNPATAVLEEAARDYDLLMIGAAAHQLLGRTMIGTVLREASLPMVIVRTETITPPDKYRRVIVPVDGSVFARYAVEFAFAYAAAAQARVTLLHVISETQMSGGALWAPERREAHGVAATRVAELQEGFREDFNSLASADEVPWDIRILASGDPAGTIIQETDSGYYDLLVLGAEKKILNQPLFFGEGTATIVEHAGCTTAVVIPRLE